MSRVPALTFCRIVAGSASNTSIRNPGRSLRNSLMACGRMFAATSCPAPTDSVSLACLTVCLMRDMASSRSSRLRRVAASSWRPWVVSATWRVVRSKSLNPS
jgi:hypothetical protein